jgi:hypothetical protein
VRFADVTLVFDLLHAVALCSPLQATEYDGADLYRCEQVARGFDLLHRHALIEAEAVADATGYRNVDYRIQGLTDKGRRIYHVLLQTQLSSEEAGRCLSSLPESVA